MNKMKTLLGLALISFALSGCYYINIQQGNAIHPEQVAQLTPGMSKEEVRYIMGSPVLESAFNDDRWDYVYTNRDHRRHKTMKKVAVTFKNNRLQRVEE